MSQMIDLDTLCPVVIIEGATAMRLVEFERGEWTKAHQYATDVGTSGECRVLVSARVRECGNARFLKEHKRGPWAE